MLAAVSEGLTGLILFVYPPIVIRVLFGTEIAGAGVLMSRIAGISQIALGLACWPDRNLLRAFIGMLTYSLLSILYLVYVGGNIGAGSRQERGKGGATASGVLTRDCPIQAKGRLEWATHWRANQSQIPATSAMPRPSASTG